MSSLLLEMSTGMGGAEIDDLPTSAMDAARAGPRPSGRRRLAAHRQDLEWGGRACRGEALEEFVRRRSSLEA